MSTTYFEMFFRNNVTGDNYNKLSHFRQPLVKSLFASLSGEFLYYSHSPKKSTTIGQRIYILPQSLCFRRTNIKATRI